VEQDVQQVEVYKEVSDILSDIMKEAVGRFSRSSKSRTGIIYVPADLTTDASFPLEHGEVLIRIEGEKLVIEKRKKGGRGG